MVEKDYLAERKRMVREQILSRGVQDPRVLTVMECVPRHHFILTADQAWAYSDGPLPIGHGQTISQPYIVALMSELLELNGSERVLEVGTGCGYQAAVLGNLAAEVHTIELIPELAEFARTAARGTGLPQCIRSCRGRFSGLEARGPLRGHPCRRGCPLRPSTAPRPIG